MASVTAASTVAVPSTPVNVPVASPLSVRLRAVAHLVAVSAFPVKFPVTLAYTCLLKSQLLFVLL